MAIEPKSMKNALRLTLALLLVLAVGARAQDKDADAKGKPDSGSKNARLTIVVTGGEEKKPIDGASVYQEGVCHVPVIPPGKFLVQVIAEGWKTYGEYYDASQTEQTINITLARPPKWY